MDYVTIVAAGIIASSLLSVLAIFISLRNNYLSKEANDLNKAFGKTEKAHEMAKVYEELMKDTSLLSSIISAHREIWAIANNISYEEMKDFNTEERDRKFDSDANRSCLEKFFVSKESLCIQTLQIELATFGRRIEFYLPEDNENLAKFISYERACMVFEEMMICTLNKLEWFSMAFTTGLADETVVYQSLHQSFLNVVKLLYFKIASCNENIYDKYYVNTIGLFHIWSSRQQEAQEEVRKMEEEKAQAIQMVGEIYQPKQPKPKIKVE